MVRVGRDALGPPLVVAVVEVLEDPPQGSFELLLVHGHGTAEADDERHQVTLGVRILGELPQCAAQPVEGAARRGVGQVLQDQGRRGVAAEDRTRSEARVLGVRDHVRHGADDIVGGGQVQGLGGLVGQDVIEGVRHVGSTDRGRGRPRQAREEGGTRCPYPSTAHPLLLARGIRCHRRGHRGGRRRPRQPG